MYRRKAYCLIVYVFLIIALVLQDVCRSWLWKRLQWDSTF